MLLAVSFAMPSSAQFFSCNDINGVSVTYTPGGSSSFRVTIDHDAFDLNAYPCAWSELYVVSSPTATSSWGVAGGWNGCINVQAGVDSFDFDVDPQLSVFYLRHYFSGSPNKFGCGLTYGPFLNGDASFLPYGAVGDSSANALSLIGAGGSGVPSTLELYGAPALSPGLIAISAEPAGYQAYGGTIYIDGATVIFVPVVADAQGVASLGYTADASVLGVSLYAQAAVLDPAQAGGWALSQGLEVVL